MKQEILYVFKTLKNGINIQNAIYNINLTKCLGVEMINKKTKSTTFDECHIISTNKIYKFKIQTKISMEWFNLFDKIVFD